MKKLIPLILLIFISCEDKTSNSESDMKIPNDEFRYFKIAYPPVNGETANFIVRTSNPEVITKLENQMSKPIKDRSQHINGTIISGNGGYNYDWSWRFKDDSWSVVDMSIELCDGNPFYIEENLDYFINRINGQYCPWSSVVEKELFPGEDIN